MGWRFGGGVEITDKSRAAIKLNWSVLGIGVAVKVSVSTFSFIVFNLSFTATPNFCSSSIMRSPKSLNLIFLFVNWCVPMIISILPSLTPSMASFFCLVVLNRFK